MRAVLLAVVLGSCVHAPIVPSSDTFIRLERTLLLGAPLEYELTVYDDGLVTYASKTHQRSSRTSKEEAQRLLSLWKKLGDPLGWGCDPERPVHESPGGRVTVSRAGVRESVKHDSGDLCVAEGLWGLEEEIEGVGRDVL